MSQLQSLVGVLLDQENSRVVITVDLANDVENLLNDDRCQTERRFIEQQQARACHQGTRNRQHLLLTTGEGPAQLATTLGKDREKFHDHVDILLDQDFIRAQISAHLQVLHDRHVRENPTAFRNLNDSHLDDLVTRQSMHRLALEKNLTRTWGDNPAKGHQRRGFTGTVGADQGNYLAFMDVKRDTFQRLDITVIRIDIIDFKHRRLPRRGRPRSPSDYCEFPVESPVRSFCRIPSRKCVPRCS